MDGVMGIIDPTLLPPPSYDRPRADQVYGEAFRRAVEFSALQHIPGDVLEFGTLNGYTARKLAQLMVEIGHKGNLWLFDSFEGMPEADSEVDRASYEINAGAWKQGTPRIRIHGVSSMIETALAPIIGRHRLNIVSGWFDETMQALPRNAPPSIVHIDCDLYESTLTVLRNLCQWDLVQDGLVLLFDDWNCGRGSPQFGERKALSTAIAEFPFYLKPEPWFSYGWHGRAFICHR